MMSCRSILGLLIGGSLFAGSAFAGMCVTHSHGLSFVSEARDVDQATTEVLSQCQRSPITINSECSQNLACGYHLHNPYPSGVAACTTSSHSIGFQSSGSASSINDIVSRVLSNCQATSVTINSECSSNLHCGDQQDIDLPYPSGRVHCSAESHHILFELRGDANQVSSVATSVLSKCQANPVTVNSECLSGLACVDDGWNHPPHHGDDDDHDYPGHDGHGHDHPPIHSREAVCTTFSHNITFTKRGPRDQIDELTNEVLAECNRNPVTINSECSRNLSCR